MAKTYYFYDLETTGISPRADRIMQFAGQRTDENLNPVGESHNILIKLTEDVLPSPDAILVTGITPQKTIQEGITEKQFLDIFLSEIKLPDTTFVGFNNIRFDDEFIRFLLYRNFADPYEWQWKEGCSRWDLLDLTRITRALRPDGITWPFAADGKPTNRLEFIASVNKLEHSKAHDALSDVLATIDLARLIKQKQPKLFDYNFNLRSKKSVKSLVDAGQPVVYSSGKYPNEYVKTTVVVKLSENADSSGALVYDLRSDPDNYAKLTPEQLAESWTKKREEGEERFPIKSMQYNRCPAISPLGVLDEASQKRISIDMNQVRSNLKKLKTIEPKLVKNVAKALEIINSKRKEQISGVVTEVDVDSRLYDNFIPDSDKKVSEKIRRAPGSELAEFKDKLSDSRLKILLPLYKARNFPDSLSPEETKNWNDFRRNYLSAGNRLNKFAERLGQLALERKNDQNALYLLEELQLWGESIAPEPN